MAAAYEGLSERMQRFISGLEAVHDFKPFKELFDDDEEGWQRLRKFEDLYRPVTHPVVRVHPVTGKKALFVNPQFTLYVKGMEETESRTLLDALFRTVHTLEYQYRHQWEPNMVVFWDNRWILHAAVHDYYPQRRMMERVTTRAIGRSVRGISRQSSNCGDGRCRLSRNSKTDRSGSTKRIEAIFAARDICR